LPLFKTKGAFTSANLRPCHAARPDLGYEFFCRTRRRTILCHSGTRSSRFTRRRPGWLGHLDSASPERLVPLFAESPLGNSPILQAPAARRGRRQSGRPNSFRMASQDTRVSFPVQDSAVGTGLFTRVFKCCLQHHENKTFICKKRKLSLATRLHIGL